MKTCRNTARSPVWNAQKLKTPLLIHTNTNDEDVNVLEVESMIRALKAENKKFEYQVCEEYRGGHIFDRIDTRIGREIRLKAYKFLNQYLSPAKPFQSFRRWTSLITTFKSSKRRPDKRYRLSLLPS